MSPRGRREHAREGALNDLTYAPPDDNASITGGSDSIPVDAPAVDNGRSRHVRAAVLATAWVAWSCASAPPPRMFYFASDLSPADAYVCVTATLRRLGFEPVPSSPDERVIVALRHTQATADSAGEWWQITSRVTVGADSATAVESEAGSSASRDGPFVGPPSDLASVLGQVAARCQWPAQNPSR